MNVERAIKLYKNSLTNLWLVFFISMICCPIFGKRVLNFFEFRKKIREKKPGKLYTPFGKIAFGKSLFFRIREIVIRKTWIGKVSQHHHYLIWFFKNYQITNGMSENKIIIHYDVRSKSVLNVISYNFSIKMFSLKR